MWLSSHVPVITIMLMSVSSLLIMRHEWIMHGASMHLEFFRYRSLLSDSIEVLRRSFLNSGIRYPHHVSSSHRCNCISFPPFLLACGGVCLDQIIFFAVPFSRLTSLDIPFGFFFSRSSFFFGRPHCAYV